MKKGTGNRSRNAGPKHVLRPPPPALVQRMPQSLALAIEVLSVTPELHNMRFFDIVQNVSPFLILGAAGLLHSNLCPLVRKNVGGKGYMWRAAPGPPFGSPLQDFPLV